MNSRQQVSRAAIDLIKRFEGYRRKAAQLPDGRWTIGYGHTLTARAGAEVSESDAEALLMYDLIAVAHAVNEQVFTPLNQNQFDALCAFAFNVGVEDFRRSSVLRRINAGELIQAACAMELWRRAEFEGEEILVDALVRRRAAEKTLFLTPPNGFVPAPSPVLRPRLDADLLGAVPHEAPTELDVALEGERVVVLRTEGARPAASGSRPTATEVAAAALATRLQSIAAEPATTVEPRPEPALAAAGGGRVIAFAPPQEDAASAPLSLPVAANESEPGAAEPELPLPPTVRLTLPPTPPRRVRQARRREALQLFGLAVMGLALFAWALFWAFNARHGQGQGLLSPVVVAWVVGVIGVGAFGLSAYWALDRLGRTDEVDPGFGP